MDVVAFTAGPIKAAADPTQEDSVWVIYAGETYCVPMSYVRRHPRGRQLILPYANRDITVAYDNSGHSKAAMRTLRKFADDSKTVVELQQADAVQREAQSQATWNLCVRVGCVLSVAAAIGAVYVRCRQRASASC